MFYTQHRHDSGDRDGVGEVRPVRGKAAPEPLPAQALHRLLLLFAVRLPLQRLVDGGRWVRVVKSARLPAAAP